MDNEVYAITNIEGYATEMRQAAANAISDDCDDDLDAYINLKQMISIIEENCIGFDDNDRPLLNEETNEQIWESTVTWINNVGLAKLAAQDLIQCAWDNESNEMVFWANPLTDVKEKRKKTNDKSIKRRNKKKDTGS
jgi:hypothetical protein